MEDRNKEENAVGDEGKERLAERKSEATSHQTLSEIEETEGDLVADSPKRDPGPSPDGSLDEPDEIKDAGPI
jgi:hypothetical protein